MTHNDSRAKKRKSSEAALRQWYEQHSWLSFVKYRPVQLAKAHGALVLDGAQSQADIVKAASGNMEELLTNCLSGTGWGASPSALPVAASRSRSPPSPLPPLAPPGAPAAPAFPRRPAVPAVPSPPASACLRARRLRRCRASEGRCGGGEGCRSPIRGPCRDPLRHGVRVREQADLR